MRCLLCIFLLASLNSYAQNQKLNAKGQEIIYLDNAMYINPNGDLCLSEYGGDVNKVRNGRTSIAMDSLTIDSAKKSNILTIVNSLIDEAKTTKCRMLYIEIDSVGNEVIMRTIFGESLNGCLLPDQYYNFSGFFRIDDTFVMVEEHSSETFFKQVKRANYDRISTFDHYMSQKHDYYSCRYPDINLVRYYMYNNGEFEEIRIVNMDMQFEKVKKAISFFSQFKNNMKYAPVYDGEKTLWTEPESY